MSQRPDAGVERLHPTESEHPVTPGTTFVVVLTVIVVAFAAAIAIWMYWLAGAITT